MWGYGPWVQATPNRTIRLRDSDEYRENIMVFSCDSLASQTEFDALGRFAVEMMRRNMSNCVVTPSSVNKWKHLIVFCMNGMINKLVAGSGFFIPGFIGQSLGLGGTCVKRIRCQRESFLWCSLLPCQQKSRGIVYHFNLICCRNVRLVFLPLLPGLVRGFVDCLISRLFMLWLYEKVPVSMQAWVMGIV